MPEQIKLFDKGKHDKKNLKRKMGRLGENLREFIETKVDRICTKCGQMIPAGSPAVKLAPLERGKPVVNKIEYFHPKGECPDLPIEDEPDN